MAMIMATTTGEPFFSILPASGKVHLRQVLPWLLHI